MGTEPLYLPMGDMLAWGGFGLLYSLGLFAAGVLYGTLRVPSALKGASLVRDPEADVVLRLDGVDELRDSLKNALQRIERATHDLQSSELLAQQRRAAVDRGGDVRPHGFVPTEGHVERCVLCNLPEDAPEHVPYGDANGGAPGTKYNLVEIDVAGMLGDTERDESEGEAQFYREYFTNVRAHCEREIASGGVA